VVWDEVSRSAVTRWTWGPALVIGIAAVASAEEPHTMWSSSSVNGFDWTPGSRVYTSKEACEQAAVAQRQRVAARLDLMRRIGADDVVQRLVGDRVYECRPLPTAPAPNPSRGPREAP
jgi:hypothetical protein